MPAQFCIFLRAKNVRFLESLDCFSGKGKAKQMDTLKKFLSNAEVVNIKYPEKVLTIIFPLYHNTLHSMYVVLLSLKHYRKIFWSCTKGSG